VLVFIFLQHFAFAIDVTFFRRPQRQSADGVGEARALDGIAFFFQFFRSGVVRREEHFERRAVLDLGVELAGGSVGGDQFVPGVFFEVGSNGLDRRGEVGGNRHLHLIGVSGAKGKYRQQRSQASGGKT